MARTNAPRGGPSRQRDGGGRAQRQHRSSPPESGNLPGGSRPLHDAATAAARRPEGNAGLWYDKFCDRWRSDWTGFAGEGGKRDWIEQIANIGTSASSKKVGHSALLTEAAARVARLVGAREGSSFQLSTAWRFVTGLGRSHPVENGFAWHHALGTPYIAGSGLKGLARAYARDWEGLSGDGLHRIFGPKSEDGLAIGSVVFLDALPAEPVALDADVMTPHYGPWYESGKIPGDWHSPIPIPFLAVAPDQTFSFAVLPREPSKQQDRDDCITAARLLKEALETLGAGAKTAAGYGQFVQHSDGKGEAASPRLIHAGAVPRESDRENWTGREAIVYGEIVRILADRGQQLLVRFPDAAEEEVERREAKLR
jgi:CRISPR-associated protein Cmr6